MAARFPPPWPVEESGACFVVRDASGRQFSISRKSRGDDRQPKLLTKDEARRIAVNIAKLPELLGKA